MIQYRSTTKMHTRLLQIGLEVIPVYGDDEFGWSLDSADVLWGKPGGNSSRLRYKTLDELFFVLTNMNLGREGAA